MKSQVIGILAASAGTLILTGCFTGMKPEPGNPAALLQPIRKGEQVIVRTAFDVKPAKNKVTHGQIMQLLSPFTDDVNIKYSISSVTLQPGQYTTLHSLSVPETFYSLSGNGILKVNDKDYVLRPGVLIYVPANMKQTVVNDSKNDMMFLSLISPAYQPSLEKDLTKLKPAPKSNMPQDGLFTGKYSETPVNMGKEKPFKIQTLTPNENKGADIK